MEMEYDEFRATLDRILGAWIRDSDLNAQAMWSALANIEWVHSSGSIASLTFRIAGHLIADIRDDGSDYYSWYGCGPYAAVAPEIEDAMARNGWAWREIALND